MANKNIKSVNLLPEFLRTDKNSKFLSSTIDQLIQPTHLERIDGFIGSKLTPTYVSTSDVYISESLPLRRDYQLEPALVVKDSLGKIKQVKAIDDIANEIATEGGLNEDFDRLFRSDHFSYDPHIDFDKFVNYQNYYWLTTGPDTIVITGKQRNTTSTYTVTDNELKTAWIFSPDGLTEDPVITLYKGNTYQFDISSVHKFYIKTSPSLDISDSYNTNIFNNGTNSGIVTLIVDENTPPILYYVSDSSQLTLGQFVIKGMFEDAYIDIEEEILGKKNYQSGNGISLSNGMKIRFGGEVYPENYRDKEYFVEGVGRAIRLIEYNLLTGSEKLAAQFDDDYDANPFDGYPFDNFRQLPITPEYMTINRSSRDLNPWSRYNRWVHADVIKMSAEANNLTPVYPANKRATRPIIEFSADLQLYNFGTVGVKNIDLIDNDTLDAFSIVEGSAGYHIDGILLEQGHRVIFNADTDPLVRGKIYEVRFILINGRPRLELLKTEDHDPVYGASLSTNLGTTTEGKSWWFNGNNWQLSQQHETLNQPPLFDLFDKDGFSYSDTTQYNTNFAGSKIFSYAVGTGTVDPVLGFPLSYKNNVGVGSYKFKNYFSTDVISIFENNVVTQVPTALAYVRFNDPTGDKFANVWTQSPEYEISILQFTSIESATSSIELTALENPSVTIFDLDVYVNNNKLASNKWNTEVISGKLFVNFDSQLLEGTDVLFKIYTKADPTNSGWYETPLSLTNNPLNGPIEYMTLTEISDHLKSMAELSPDFIGAPSGLNNVRDIPDIAKFGSRLISNSNPISFVNFFIGIKEHSVIDAITKSADQYNQFKLSFLKKITELANQDDPVFACDVALKELNLDKDLNSPWNLSDMAAYGTDKIVRTWTVTDSRNTVYPITADFDTGKPSLRSVLVYLNGKQLLRDRDYKFIVNDSNVEILTQLSVGDTLVVNDYTDTTGSYIPSTPTKLGLYPKFEPKIYDDTSYAYDPVKVIQGHDGSITAAYGDLRDQILLELETRIYNNIKTEYRPELFDINSIIPGAFRDGEYSVEDINTVLQKDFIRWAGFYGVDYIPNNTFDLDNPFTWNYTDGYNITSDQIVSGYWRSFFKFFYDTDRPHTHPWEMLGFSVEPLWWQDEYGPLPYTSGNEILWSDLEKGLVKQGPTAGIISKYARPGLSSMIPVDESGNLIDPSKVLITDYTPYNIRQNWKFGDHSPAETAWRRSSYWPFAVQRLLALTSPVKYTSLMYDPSRISKNIAGQWTYGDEYRFLDLRSVELFGYNNTLTSGYSVYISEIGRQRSSSYLTTLKDDLSYVDFNLFHKVGGFISKSKLQIIIDAIEPNSTSPGALLPQEDYNLILNISNPIKSIGMSGIVIQKTEGKYVVKGYDKYNPYFTILQPRRNINTPNISVGGVSEPYLVWSASGSVENTGLNPVDTTTAVSSSSGKFYQQGQLVKNGNTFYRVKTSHRAGNTFDSTLFQQLPAVPMIGGISVQIAAGFEKQSTTVPYGTEFTRVQDLYDMIVGYGKWLEGQGFIFDEYNSDLNALVDWNLSAKEFLYWTTQNWADNSVITLSPFANRVKYTLPHSVVDNIFDSFYEYSVQKADGLPFPRNRLNVNRENGVCTVETISTTEGIYFIELNSVQKEHAMVFNNTTVFNDTIYDVETGYRQRRMKLVGFRTLNWDGDYFSPGFVYDSATITDWKVYTDYVYADVVRYNGNYYSAKENIIGSDKFDFNSWVLLGEKPLADLIPNFDYKINQFEDFYSLDIDNFDASQQKMAQHLIGYTPRVYLNNVFTNPIAQYKFYQGYIKEKGTRNAINKLAKATIFNLQGEVDFKEEWAFRIGHYGSYSTYQEIEVPLFEGTFIENPQIVNFVDTKPTNPIDLIYYSTSSGLSIKPDDYLATDTFTSTSTNNFKLPVAGYVSFDDITATAYNESSLLDIANNGTISNGDTIWLGFKQNGDWDVLQYQLSSARIVGVFVSNPASDITFVTDLHHGISVGSIISITNFNNQVNGVYKIKAIPRPNQLMVASDLVSITNDELLTPGLLYEFAGVRASNFSNLPNDSQMLKLKTGTKFWIDNKTSDGKFDWKVYEKIDNFTTTNILVGSTIPNQQLGHSIAKQPGSNIVVVGAPGYNSGPDIGRVFVYEKNGTTSQRRFSYTLNDGINTYHTTGPTDLGYSVAYTKTEFGNTGYGLIYAGAPSTSFANWKSNEQLRYSDGTGAYSDIENEGAVKISSIDPRVLREVTEVVLLSPSPNKKGRFGHAIVVNGPTNNLYVGAPGEDVGGVPNVGKLHLYQTLSPIATTFVTSTSTIGTDTIYVNSIEGLTKDYTGYAAWVPGVLDNILVNQDIIVKEIYDDDYLRYIKLNGPITSNIEPDTIINFYDVKSPNVVNMINASIGSFMSDKGLLISYVGVVSPSTTVVNSGTEFGYSVSLDTNGLSGVVGAPGADFVEVYLNLTAGLAPVSNNPIIPSIINSPWTGTSVCRFGESVKMSNGGDYIFVGAPSIINEDQSYGKVFVYKIQKTSYTYTDWQQEYELSDEDLHLGKEIANMYYLSNTYFANSHRYGLYRTPDAGGLNYWVGRVNSERLSNPNFTVADLESFIFNAVDAYPKSVDYNRSFTANKLFDPGRGSGEFYDRGVVIGLDSIISNPVPGPGMHFGKSIGIESNTLTLAISAIGLNTSVPVQFENDETTFDSVSTRFYDTVENFGTVYLYNRDVEGSRFVLVEELTPDIVTKSDFKGTSFGKSLLVEDDVIFAGAPAISSETTATFYQFTKVNTTKSSLSLYKSMDSLVDIDTVQKISLIDTHNESVIDYLDVIDPIKGKIAGIADQEIKYKSAYDPAIYSIGTAGVVVDTDTSWVDDKVGQLWWDLSTVKYTWYEQGDLTYRKNNWGRLFPGSTIDVYEWVGTPYLPSEWSAVADTSAGLTEGISGQPKYVDNSVISVKQIYNSVTNSFSNYYFYWVKNKVTVPSAKNRRISAFQVASIIADPTSYGLKHANVIAKDAIALANVGSLLVDNRIHLNISQDIIKNTIPRHTEWTLLQEGSSSSLPPALYEKKLFDSLLGKDSLGNIVPDSTLTERTRYGISVRPRQTMFKDRRAALRNLIEFTNNVLLENQVTGNFSFINLNQQELPPDEFSHEYDQIVEDNEGIGLVDTRLLEQAELSCTVYNGRINSITIVNPGLGYKISPNVTIDGINGGKITTEINSVGQVVSAKILDPGKEYISPPVLNVRPYTIIVLTDNLYNGKWTKFEWNRHISQWERIRTQKYNTQLYWDYVDWKSNNYNEFIDYSHTVNQVYQLDELEDVAEGQYVKVKNVGDGRYIILQKTPRGVSGTFGKGYDLVFSQNGTIQIRDSIWDVVDSKLAFDKDNNYDQTLYDQTADLELYYILYALKNDIFINELKINWNLFFFNAVKYALTEQKFLDWAFKTSFIDVTNYAGYLDQRPVYKLQDSSYYEDYIKEVKPYHSQIRTFTANHAILEPSNTYVTDFDLPSYYDQDTNKFECVSDYDPILDTYPWKAWKDNYLYSVGSISVGNGGSGYINTPQVIIKPAPGDSGSGATARAYIGSGRVIRVEVTNPGSGYRQTPIVSITGGGGTNLVPAVLYAQLYNSKVRTNQIGIKFDRITRNNTIGDFNTSDRFLCNGSDNEFVLTWVTESDKSKIIVTLDGDLVLGSDYKVVYYSELYNGYNKQYSKIVFVNFVPGYGQVLEVQYNKNIELFNAAERIISYYTATTGMPGSDLPQLMKGVEYPGVRIEGLPFDYSTEWDIEYSPFGKGLWADNISYYEQLEIVSPVSAGDWAVTLSTTTGVVVGQLVNIISADKDRADATVFAIQIADSNADVKVAEIYTDTRIVRFSSPIAYDIIEQPNGKYATVEFWSYDPNASILDSAIEGGTWNTLTDVLSGALGINPEDVVIDGDSFITSHTSYGPEELVPGETYDSIGINVYTRNSEGAPTMFAGSIDVWAKTTTTSRISFVPPNKDSIFVTFDNKIFKYTTSTSFLTSTNSTLFYYNWETNELSISPQTEQGKLGYNIVGIGGGRPLSESGVIDRGFAVVNDGSIEAEVESLSSIYTVKSAYVTVNGSSIPLLETVNTSTLGYILTSSGTNNNRAAAHVYNLSTSTTSTVQAWFFGTKNKYFNEFKEETFVVGTNVRQVFTLEQPPRRIEPVAANIIVELNEGNGFRRLTPPFISYYQADPSVLVYKIDNHVDHPVGSYPPEVVRVYINGRQLTSGAEYVVDSENRNIILRTGIAQQGDAIAVLSTPLIDPKAEFDVIGSDLILSTPIFNAELKVTTFTNHDDMMVRTEHFAGTLNRRYKVSRPVVNDNYVWVDVNGIPLRNKIDFIILDDRVTIQLGDAFNTLYSDSVVITTISSDKLAETVLGYRIFNDIFNRTHFKRLSKKNSTYLTKPLSFTDTEIHVNDASVLTPPLVSKKIPGVVIIDAERIEFFKVEGNVLKQLRRSTLGTSPGVFQQVGTKVIDQSPEQTIPFSENHYKQIIYTNTTTNTYVISTVTSVVSNPIDNINTATSDGIILSTIATATDQVMVYYGGRLLRKSGTFYHDTTISYDSPEFKMVGFTATTQKLPAVDVIGTAYVVTSTNQVWVYSASNEYDAVNGYVYKGLNYLEPEFYINTSTQEITLNIEGGIQDNIKVVISKKDFSRNNVWNDEVSIVKTKTLMDSTTIPARFLQARPSELPDRYYYGGGLSLDFNSGISLTDENNEPLEGF